MACTRHTEVEWKIRFYSGREDSQIRWEMVGIVLENTVYSGLSAVVASLWNGLQWSRFFVFTPLWNLPPRYTRVGLGDQPYTAEMMAGRFQDNHMNEQRSSSVSSPNGTLRWLWPGSVAWLHPCEGLRQNLPETEWDHKTLPLSRSICVICYTAIDN